MRSVMDRPADDRAIAPLRVPERVMRLEHMGASFQTRLSFMCQLIRRMRRERWRFERLRFDLDARGYGTAVYAAHGPQRTYSLVVRRAILIPQYLSTSIGYRADRRAMHMSNNSGAPKQCRPAMSNNAPKVRRCG